MKRRKLMSGALCGAFAIVIVLAVVLSGGKTLKQSDVKEINSNISSDVVVNTPVNVPSDNTSTTGDTKNEKPLSLDVGGNPNSSSATSSIGSKAKTPDKTITPATPTESSKPSDGIVIGGNEPANPDNSETIAFLQNLAAKGCPYCGLHDECPSFHAVDEWGNPVYDPTKCPKYDITKNPVYYCQTCHMKTGDGSNGTCVQFVNDCYCPLCGEFVPAHTCHTCK